MGWALVPMLASMLVPLLLAQPPTAGQGAFATGAERFAPNTPPPPPRMSKDEYERAKPIPDTDAGSRWTIKLGSALGRRWGHVGGEPSLFALSRSYVDTPFENRLLGRMLADGSFNIDAPPVPVIYQVVDSPNEQGIACTQSDAVDSNGDILFIRYLREGVARRFCGHECAPWRIVFSPDGTRLVSCADDRTMRLWDVASGKEIARFPGYGLGGNLADGRRGEFVAFSPDGKWLVTAFEGRITFRRPSDGGKEIVWDTAQHGMIPDIVRFSVDSQSLFAFGGWLRPREEPSVRFLQFVMEGFHAGVRKFKGTSAPLDGITTPDGKSIITRNGSPQISVWNIEKRKEVRIAKVASKHVYDMALSPTGGTLATASDEDCIKFWDTASFCQRSTARAYRHPNVNCVRFSADGKSLVTAGTDGWLKVWDAPEFTWVPQLTFHGVAPEEP